ncbi:MAG TPA: DUF5818 domain-containing protein [Acidobacteriaceae bacterium]|jgi:hypothetical protein
MGKHNRTLAAEGLAALLVLAVAPAASAVALHPQPYSLIQETTQPNTEVPNQPDSQQEQQKAVVVMGTIIKQGQNLVLKDEKGVVYRLDLQEKAEPYLNQSVKVTGKLEPADASQVALLHVQQIEPVTA